MSTQKHIIGLKRDSIIGILLILPLVLFILVFTAYPFLAGIWLSLTKKIVGFAPRFVGFQNYEKLLGDWVFRRTVINTFVYTFSSLAAKFTIGWGMALLLNQAMKGRSFLRALFLLPWVTPQIIIALTWLWMFNDMKGIINWFLVKSGFVESNLPWFSSPGLAMFAVIVVNIWRGIPFYGISFLAGLQAVPGELYEAAAIDGASAWQKWMHITIPYLKNLIAIVVLLGTIWTFNDFQIVYVLTRGGPAYATELFSILTYDTGIKGLKLGEGVAVSLMLFPFLALIIIFLAKFMLKEE